MLITLKEIYIGLLLHIDNLSTVNYNTKFKFKVINYVNIDTIFKDAAIMSILLVRRVSRLMGVVIISSNVRRCNFCVSSSPHSDS